LVWFSLFSTLLWSLLNLILLIFAIFAILLHLRPDILSPRPARIYFNYNCVIHTSFPENTNRTNIFSGLILLPIFYLSNSFLAWPRTGQFVRLCPP
jgi:hypothetical protein